MTPEVYGSEDGDFLYVPTRRYPTELGARRAIARSPWTEMDDPWARWSRTGVRVVDIHLHEGWLDGGCTYGEPDENGDAATTCGTPLECHVFEPIP